ncbi:MAG: carboxypeptidase regulatory-like domain-containing protein [Planctomycetota bacterium]
MSFDLHDCAHGCIDDIASPNMPSPVAVLSGRTDTAGNASIDLPNGIYEVTVDSPYFVQGDPTLNHPSAEPFTIELGRGATLEGAILATSGAPIGGARVAVALRDFFYRGDGPAETSRANFRIAVTDADGKYRVGGLLPRSNVRVSASATGFGTARTQAIAIQDEFLIAPPLVLRPECSIAVDVADPRGLLRAEDQVLLRVGEEFLLHGERRLPVGAARTCTFAGLPEGDYRVSLDAERATCDEVVLHVVSTGNVERLTLYAVERRPLTGIVVAKNGLPIERAGVRLSIGEEKYATETDDGGRFRLGRLSGGPARLRVTARGYQRYDESLGNLTNTHGEQTIVLDPGLGIVFSFRRSGDAVREISLECAFTPSGSSLPTKRIARDAISDDGKVELHGFGPGRISGIARNSMDSLVGRFDVELVPSDDLVQIDVELTPAVSVVGIVVDDAGLPVERASFAVEDGVGGRGLAQLGSAWTVAARTTDASGAFRVEGVDPMTSTLVVHKLGYAERRITLASVDPSFMRVVLTKRRPRDENPR